MPTVRRILTKVAEGVAFLLLTFGVAVLLVLFGLSQGWLDTDSVLSNTSFFLGVIVAWVLQAFTSAWRTVSKLVRNVRAMHDEFRPSFPTEPIHATITRPEDHR